MVKVVKLERMEKVEITVNIVKMVKMAKIVSALGTSEQEELTGTRIDLRMLMSRTHQAAEQG